LAECPAELVLASDDDGGVGDRQTHRVPEQRGDREPVGEGADHGGLGDRLEVAGPSLAVPDQRDDDEEHAHHDQQARRPALHAAAPPGVNVTGRWLMPLMNPERSRDGSPDASMSGMRRKSSRYMTVISRRAKWAPRQKCGPGPPNPTCALGSRRTSKRNGSSN